MRTQELLACYRYLIRLCRTRPRAFRSTPTGRRPSEAIWAALAPDRGRDDAQPGSTAGGGRLRDQVLTTTVSTILSWRACLLLLNPIMKALTMAGMKTNAKDSSIRM